MYLIRNVSLLKSYFCFFLNILVENNYSKVSQVIVTQKLFDLEMKTAALNL
jgi:hypothetical protein